MIPKACVISNGFDGAEGADGEMTRRVPGARGRLGGHTLKSGTRSIMVSSMGGNDVGDVDGNVASKAGDVGDNCEMTCRGQVSKGGVEYAGGVENSCGMEVSSVERPVARPPNLRPPCSPT